MTIMWKNVTGMETSSQWVLGLLLGGWILAAVVAVMADWFWRIVELPSVHWARRFEKLCFVQEER